MTIPQGISTKGNGSMVDSESVSQSARNFSKSDTFTAALNRQEKSVQDGLLQYPLDLFMKPEYKLGIRFGIYDTGGAALTENRNINRFIEDQIQKRAVDQQNQISQDPISLSSVWTGGLSVGASTIGAGTVQLGNAFKFVTNDTTQPVGGRQMTRDTFVESQTGLQGLTEYKGAVYLYMPGSLSFDSKLEYEDGDLTSLDFINALKGAVGFGNVEAQGEIVRKLGMGAIQKMDDVFEAVGGKDMVENYIKASQRQIMNPFLVHLFKGVQRRTFDFEFTMVPRSFKEAQNIDAIIQTFRRYSHPKRSPHGRFLDFPAEFDLTFMYGDKDAGEYVSVPKIKKCALSGVKVSYGENIMTTHKPDPDGLVRPTMVKMNLSFSELEILSREEIERGY